MPKLDTAGTQFAPTAIFTVEEATGIFKVSPRRMRRWVYSGKMGYTLLPGDRGRRITGAHINKALAAGNRPAV